jgi:hypothetical protein|tara:strand:+ start:1640 stop:2014 length:375 start_codon:yes stop_codon:yes gene_type:complete
MSIVSERVEKIKERWRRALACHGAEIAKAEMQFDIDLVRKAIANKENYYNLSHEEASELYPILLRLKKEALNVRGGKNRKPCSFRLSLSARIRLEYLAEKGGVSKTAVLESLISHAERYKLPRT